MTSTVITISDPKVLAALAVPDSAEVRDAAGNKIGTFVPEGLCPLPETVATPFRASSPCPKADQGLCPSP